MSQICQVAIRDERAKFKRLNQFWALVYGVSAAVAVASIVLIVSVIWGNNPTIAVGGISTVTSSGGLAWVVMQRNRAGKDHEAAKDALRKDCAAAPAAAPAEGGGLESLPDDGPAADRAAVDGGGLDAATIAALTSD